MIKLRFTLLICVWFALPLCAQARTKASERYVLRWKTVKVDYSTSDEWDIWLWDKKRKRVLWKRHVYHFNPVAGTEKGRVHWSKDHRALAVECLISDKSDKTPWRVLVWREGYRLRDFRAPNHEDYTMDCAWSPDKQRLLVLAGSSGASSTGYGNLHCLQLKPWPNYKVFKLGLAGDFTWENRRMVVFWNKDEHHDYGINGDIPAPLIRYSWHAP